MAKLGLNRGRALGALALAGSMTLFLAACSSGETAASEGGESAAAVTVNEELRALLPEEIQESGVFVIGGTYDNPPVLFASEADASKPAGVAYDLSVAVGEVLGIEPEWRNTQWPGQLPGIDSGTLDVVWGQATVTEEREAELYDMIPFYYRPWGILVEEGNPLNITSYATMCGAKIGGPIGSIHEMYIGMANEGVCVPEGKPQIQFTQYTMGEETALASGTVDGVLDTYPVLVGAAQQLKGVEAVLLTDSDDYGSGLAGIVTSKDRPGLANAIAGALQQLWDDGTYQEILESHDVADAILDRDTLVVNFLTGTPAGERQ